VDEGIEGPYYLLLREFVPLDERIRSLIRRLEEVPRVLSEAQLNLKSPPRLFCEIAKEKKSLHL